MSRKKSGRSATKRPLGQGECRKLKNGAYVCRCGVRPVFTKEPSCPRGSATN